MERGVADAKLGSGRVESAARPAWLRFVAQHYGKLLGLLFYLGIMGGSWAYAAHHSLSPMAAIRSLTELLSGSAWGPVLYVAVYAIQPVVAFPVPLLSVAAGFLFGPAVGLLAAVVGISVASSFSYLIGRYFGRDLIDSAQASGLIARYTARLRCNTFMYVLILRLVFLPYEVISMLCGFLGLPWRPFAMGTALGILPGLVALVLFGASIQGDFTGDLPSLTLDSTVLAISGAILIGSLALSWYLKVRHDHNPASDC